MFIPHDWDQMSSRDPCPLQLLPAAPPSNTALQEPKGISYTLRSLQCRGGSQPSPALLLRVPAGSFN